MQAQQHRVSIKDRIQAQQHRDNMNSLIKNTHDNSIRQEAYHFNHLNILMQAQHHCVSIKDRIQAQQHRDNMKNLISHTIDDKVIQKIPLFHLKYETKLTISPILDPIMKQFVSSVRQINGKKYYLHWKR